jgi:hypothetical protein
MAENEELQAKITALSGKINHHKQQQYQPFHQSAPTTYNHSHPGTPRWSPYRRGGAAYHRPQHKNRSLVLNGTTTPPTSNGLPVSAANASAQVSTRGANHQIMTKGTFEREQRQRQDMKEQQRQAKRQKRSHQEQSRILRHFDAAGDNAERIMLVGDIRFRLTADGSKLIRVTGMPHDDHFASVLSPADAATTHKETPKKSKIVGIDFYRTKNGNLVRASALKSPARYRLALDAILERRSPFTSRRPANDKPQCENFTKHGICTSAIHRIGHTWASTARRHLTQPTGKLLHAQLTYTAGTCPFGPRCHFAHDPNKVAICKDFLKSGACPRGTNCDLSHEMTYHRVPACHHFLRGNCTNDACRYPHVHVSPAAPVCRPFAILGFCAKGSECDKRHVYECPDYANTGFCANRESGKCALPHPDRASTLRKAAERQAKMSADDVSDLSSDEEHDDRDEMDDIDSEEEDIIMTGSTDDSHALSKQHDFVGFN